MSIEGVNSSLLIYFRLGWVVTAVWAFRCYGEPGPLFIAVCGLCVAAASLVTEHRLSGVPAALVVAPRLGSCSSWAVALEHRLISCGAEAELLHSMRSWSLPGGASGKESTGQCRRCQMFTPWVGKIPWRRKWQPIPIFLPGESHGRRSLAGYSPWGRKESDTTERLSTVAL